MSGVIHVVMLDELRERFELWLDTQDFILAHVPDEAPDQFMVVFKPDGWREQIQMGAYVRDQYLGLIGERPDSPPAGQEPLL